MKFFTYDWWKGCQDPALRTNPIPEYAAHEVSIRDLLPTSLLQLHECGLHDATLVDMHIDMVSQSIRLLIHGHPGDDHRAFTLTYDQVGSFASTTHGPDGLPGPAGYGDLGYDEFDFKDGLPVHRFLFSSGIEFEIVFGAFSIEIEALPPVPDDEDE